MGRSRRQTQAKAAREHTVRERRERKLEKKRVAAGQRTEGAESPLTEPPDSGTPARA